MLGLGRFKSFGRSCHIFLSFEFRTFVFSLSVFLIFCPCLPLFLSQSPPCRNSRRQVTITRYGSFIPNNDPRINKQSPGMVFKTKRRASCRLALHCYCPWCASAQFLICLTDSLWGRTFHSLAYPQSQKNRSSPEVKVSQNLAEIIF